MKRERALALLSMFFLMQLDSPIWSSVRSGSLKWTGESACAQLTLRTLSLSPVFSIRIPFR